MDGRQTGSGVPDVLAEAADRLAVERRRIDDELAAFAAFERAVGDIEPAAGAAGQPAVPGGAAVSTESGGLEAVRSAYERTVMAVPHYDEEYDDTYARSLVEEFGPDVATAFLAGSAFTDRHRSMVLTAAAESRAGRESMRDLLDEERRAMERARDDVKAIEDDLAAVADREYSDATFGALESARERLLELENRCEEGIDRHQETIARLRRRTLSPVDAADYREFCYEGLEVDYPVLSAYAEVLDRIRIRRREVEREMAYAHE